MLLGLATILAGSLARNDPAVSEPTFVGLKRLPADRASRSC